MDALYIRKYMTTYKNTQSITGLPDDVHSITISCLARSGRDYS